MASPDHAVVGPRRPRARRPPSFTWVHISDIHLGFAWDATGHERTLLLDALRRDLVTSVRERGWKRPSVLMVTGDTANTAAVADAGEYGRAKLALEEIALELSVPLADVMTVTGNHDVPRIPKEQRQLSRLIEKLRAGEDTLEAARHSPEDHDLLATRMAAYEKFAEAFGPGAGTMGCWTTTTETDDGLSIRLSGLNTSLLCADDQGRRAPLVRAVAVERDRDPLPRVGIRVPPITPSLLVAPRPRGDGELDAASCASAPARSPARGERLRVHVGHRPLGPDESWTAPALMRTRGER